MPEVVRIYLCMTQPLLALGAAAVFGGKDGYEVIPTPTDLKDLEKVIEPRSPSGADILVVDFAPDYGERPDSFTSQDFIASLRRVHPDLKILALLPPFQKEDTVLKALRTGASGYLFQTASPGMLLDAARVIAGGGAYLEPEMTPVVLTQLRKPSYLVQEAQNKIVLTERERFLVQLAADGLSNVQIADILGLREKTVRNLWSTLFEKLGISDRTQAVLWAVRTGNAELR
ncbi:response regulator transcription factor [Alicyclobacillus tolerans]|uniref:response regulator transcription factor n=1 Tax=Alicyclobacillus tolerans TaxID=90970 RepID=UPI001F41BEBC|nr:response regulator transcription factor [Alicyclobacillus tolerans]MCF8563830.1 response regulator transcription factor [Alicyclobacillus tolerans]